jgi:hypothetical protein
MHIMDNNNFQKIGFEENFDYSGILINYFVIFFFKGGACKILNLLTLF